LQKITQFLLRISQCMLGEQEQQEKQEQQEQQRKK
jgi:hypothetical protein